MTTSSNGNISALLAHCAGNSPVTAEFRSQRPVTRSFDIFFDLDRTKRLNIESKRWWFETPSRPFGRHRYDNYSRFHSWKGKWWMETRFHYVKRFNRRKMLISQLHRFWYTVILSFMLIMLHVTMINSSMWCLNTSCYWIHWLFKKVTAICIYFSSFSKMFWETCIKIVLVTALY